MEGSDPSGTTSSVTVGQSVVTLSSGSIDGFGNRFKFEDLLKFSAGEKLTVSVGNGDGVSPFYDSTRVISAVIFSQVPSGSRFSRLAGITNPDFEGIVGTNLVYFDQTSRLRDAHFSSFIALHSTNSFYSTNAIPGWTFTGKGAAGTWNVPANYFPAEAPAGDNVAWINGDAQQAGEIRQLLQAEPLEAGHYYRLSAMVGSPLGQLLPEWSLELRAGTNVLAHSEAQTNLATGFFSRVSVNFWATTNTKGLGKPIEIALGHGTNGAAGLLAFDTIQLEIAETLSLVLNFIPDSSPFTGSVPVQITDVPADSAVYYTTDGTEPTPDNGTEYVDRVILTATSNLRARAFQNRIPVTGTQGAQYGKLIRFDDNIPMKWREQYFGPSYAFDPNARADVDADLDGRSNFMEYIAGTDPLDKRSGFQTGIKLVPSVQWPAVVGTAYRIDRRGRLNDAPWEAWRRVVADRDPMTLTDDDGDGSRVFFRVVSVP